MRHPTTCLDDPPNAHKPVREDNKPKPTLRDEQNSNLISWDKRKPKYKPGIKMDVPLILQGLRSILKKHTQNNS